MLASSPGISRRSGGEKTTFLGSPDCGRFSSCHPVVPTLQLNTDPRSSFHQGIRHQSGPTHKQTGPAEPNRYSTQRLRRPCRALPFPVSSVPRWPNGGEGSPLLSLSQPHPVCTWLQLDRLSRFFMPSIQALLPALICCRASDSIGVLCARQIMVGSNSAAKINLPINSPVIESSLLSSPRRVKSVVNMSTDASTCRWEVSR
jgi:hypothetical protein